MYKRTAQPEILQCTKNDAKTIIIARFGMLECGHNLKGTMKEICTKCNVTDDENHRLNVCSKLKVTNTETDVSTPIEFNDVYSNDSTTLRNIIKVIKQQWNTVTAHGTTKK